MVEDLLCLSVSLFTKIINYLSLYDLIVFDKAILNHYLRERYLQSLREYHLKTTGERALSPLSHFLSSLSLSHSISISPYLSSSFMSPSLSSLSSRLFENQLNSLSLPDSSIKWIQSRQISMSSISIKPYQERDIHMISGEILSEIVSTNGIEKLKLISNGITDTWITSQQKSKEVVTSLIHSFDFSECYYLNDVLISQIFSFSYPSLTSLDLTNQTKLTSKSAKFISKRLKQLNNLDLTACSAIDSSGFNSLLHANGPTLRSLSVSRCSNFVPSNLVALSKVSSQLLSLNLSHCSSICDVSLHRVLSLCLSLASLDVSSTSVSVKAFSHLPKSTLRFNLIANNCVNMTDDAVGIISCLYRSLSSIELLSSSIHHASLISLTQCPQLKKISVSLSTPSNALSYLICKCQELEEISLVGIQPNHTTKEDAGTHNRGEVDHDSDEEELNYDPSIYHIPSLPLRLLQYGQNITSLCFNGVHFRVSELLSISRGCPKLKRLGLHNFIHSTESRDIEIIWNEVIEMVRSTQVDELSLTSNWPENVISNIISHRRLRWKIFEFHSPLCPVTITQTDIQSLSRCVNLEVLRISGRDHQITERALRTPTQYPIQYKDLILRLPHLMSISLPSS